MRRLPPWLLLAAPLLIIITVLGWFASVVALWALKDDDPFDTFDDEPDQWDWATEHWGGC